MVARLKHNKYCSLKKLLRAKGDNGILPGRGRRGDEAGDECENNRKAYHYERLPPRQRGYAPDARNEENDYVYNKRQYICYRYAYQARNEADYERFGIEQALDILLSCADSAENTYLLYSLDDGHIRYDAYHYR